MRTHTHLADGGEVGRVFNCAHLTILSDLICSAPPFPKLRMQPATGAARHRRRARGLVACRGRGPQARARCGARAAAAAPHGGRRARRAGHGAARAAGRGAAAGAGVGAGGCAMAQSTSSALADLTQETF
eukprot:351952-Chlamydomonas_euryale.AAC.5